MRRLARNARKKNMLTEMYKVEKHQRIIDPVCEVSLESFCGLEMVVSAFYTRRRESEILGPYN
jgi:hypothetical protein